MARVGWRRTLSLRSPASTATQLARARARALVECCPPHFRRHPVTTASRQQPRVLNRRRLHFLPRRCRARTHSTARRAPRDRGHGFACRQHVVQQRARASRALSRAGEEEEEEEADAQHARYRHHHHRRRHRHIGRARRHAGDLLVRGGREAVGRRSRGAAAAAVRGVLAQATLADGHVDDRRGERRRR